MKLLNKMHYSKIKQRKEFQYLILSSYNQIIQSSIIINIFTSMNMSNVSPNVIAQSRTLWMGDIEPWMDQAYIASIFTTAGLANTLTSVKVIKDKNSGLPAGYGFVQFNTHQMAQHVWQTYNGAQIPGTTKIFRLNWAIYGGGTKPYLLGPSKSVQQISIYVGDLDPSVTDNILLDFFKEKYPSVFSAKIICDSVTKYSKGYGFVKFHNSEQAQKAITDVNGTLLKGKMIKTAPAYNKNSTDNAYADINLPEDPEKQYLAMVQKQQVLQYYYSLINDPLAKLEYQKQLEQMYGFDITKQPKKKSLKSDLESIRSLQYSETVSSQPFLENLPKMIAYKSKMTVENRIFQ